MIVLPEPPDKKTSTVLPDKKTNTVGLTFVSITCGVVSNLVGTALFLIAKLCQVLDLWLFRAWIARTMLRMCGNDEAGRHVREKLVENFHGRLRADFECAACSFMWLAKKQPLDIKDELLNLVMNEKKHECPKNGVPGKIPDSLARNSIEKNKDDEVFENVDEVFENVSDYEIEKLAYETVAFAVCEGCLEVTSVFRCRKKGFEFDGYACWSCIEEYGHEPSKISLRLMGALVSASKKLKKEHRTQSTEGEST